MTETEFLQQVKLLFDAICEHIESHNPDLDVLAHGALVEIENDDGAKVIVNQQASMNEVWLASREGGYHFKFNGSNWVNTRDNVDFWDYLSRAIALIDNA